MILSATPTGKLLPVAITYKSIGPIAANGPEGAAYSSSETGWVDTASFENYFRKIVFPWADSLPGVKVVIGNYPSTHFSLAILHECQSKNIRFVQIPAATGHVRNPVKVCFFQRLKELWRKSLTEWRFTTDNDELFKEDFPKLLKLTLEKIKPLYPKVESCFRSCGMWPISSTSIFENMTKM